MITRLLIVLGIATLTLGFGCDKHAKDKAEVRGAWESYRAAADSGDGSTACTFLARPTVDHYDRLLKLALDAPATEVWKLRPTEMAEIGAMRLNYTRKQLRGVSGAGYVSMAIKDGFWSTFDAEWKLTNVSISQDGKTAKALIHNPRLEAEARSNALSRALGGRRVRRLVDQVGPSPRFDCGFVKDGSTWKYDEMPTISNIDKLITELAKEEQMSVRDYLTLTMSGEDTLKAGLKMWEPMKK